MKVRVLGAGIAGLASAEELLRRGHTVEVVDPAPASGASTVAAGMLCPSAETWHGEETLLELGLRSLDAWPGYAGRLGVELHPGGTLLVGADRGDRQQVEQQVSLLAGQGREVPLLTGSQARDLEPGLAPRVAGAAHLPDDPSVDPRAVLAALRQRLGESVVGEPSASGRDPEVTVIATGTTLPTPYASLVRGVRGEILRARTDDPPGRTVRGWVRGSPVYVVPRAGGEIVIGATSEEHDAPPEVTLGGVERLLRDARALLPGLDRATLLQADARDRPGTPDNLPLVGPTGRAGEVLAAGHFRHGVLLAPLTAQLVADAVEDGRVEPALDPRRFDIAGSRDRDSQDEGRQDEDRQHQDSQDQEERSA